MISLVHISDVHLDAGFESKNPSVKKRLREAQWEALARAVRFAIDREVDAVCIAGDLFDHVSIAMETEISVRDAIEQLAGNRIHVLYVCGNHDPWGVFSDQSANAYVHFFQSDMPEVLTLKTRGGTPFKVVGCSHMSKAERRNIISTFPSKADSMPWIGIAHASVPSALTVSGKERYMPAALSDIERLGYDYFALGHIHIRQMLSERVGYSGSLQGLNIKETGDKGGLYVRIDGPSIEVEPVNFAPIHWIQMDIDVSSSSDTEGLSRQLENRILETLESERRMVASSAVRLILSGRTALKRSLETRETLAFLEGHLGRKMGLLSLEIRMGTLLSPLSPEVYLGEKTVLSDILKVLSGGIHDDVLMKRLLSLPIQIPGVENPDSADMEAWLEAHRALLMDTLLERMVKQNDAD